MITEDFELSWCSMYNKIHLQEYFYNWMTLNYESDKELYFGGIKNEYECCIKLERGQKSSCPDLSSTQEETDDRIMFHISHGCNNGIKSVQVVSPDLDVSCSLVYHFKHTWNLNELFMRLRSGKTRRNAAIHTVV